MSMYHLNENHAKKYDDILQSFQPKAYFGYASAIFLLARMYRLSKLDAPKSAVAAFTTAEVLYPEWLGLE